MRSKCSCWKSCSAPFVVVCIEWWGVALMEYKWGSVTWTSVKYIKRFSFVERMHGRKNISEKTVRGRELVKNMILSRKGRRIMGSTENVGADAWDGIKVLSIELQKGCWRVVKAIDRYLSEEYYIFEVWIYTWLVMLCLFSFTDDFVGVIVISFCIWL